MNETDDLRARVARLEAEVGDLRQRLDAQKKGAATTQKAAEEEVTSNGLTVSVTDWTVVGGRGVAIFREGGLTVEDSRLLFKVASAPPNPCVGGTFEQWEAVRQGLIRTVGVTETDVILPGSVDRIRSKIEQALREQAKT